VKSSNNNNNNDEKIIVIVIWKPMKNNMNRNVWKTGNESGNENQTMKSSNNEMKIMKIIIILIICIIV
jgi:hypothetical protein